MRFSAAAGHKVVATSTASTVGKVSGFVVDPESRQVVALHLKKTDGDADTLLWSALTAFGPDAVTVTGADVLSSADGKVAELGDKHHTLLGKRVLTEDGDAHGKVDDVEFDPETGAITALITENDEIPGARLAGVGSYAVVVRRA